MHVALVFIVHPTYNIAHMMLGENYNDITAAQFAQAVTMLIIGIVVAIALWIGASYWSLSNLRRTQRWIWGATQPIRALTIDRLKSRQVAKKTFTEDDISPFHWVNTRPPTKEQSEEYITLREDDFKDFRLEIGGLVEEEKSFSIDELKALGKVTNITMHTCMQGWTGIAKWEGIRLKDLLEHVTPTEGAHYLMATSFGHVGHTYDGRPTEPYYECIDPSMIDDDECILAWGMNDEPLPSPPTRRFPARLQDGQVGASPRVDPRLPRGGRWPGRFTRGFGPAALRRSRLIPRLRALPRLPPRPHACACGFEEGGAVSVWQSLRSSAQRAARSIRTCGRSPWPRARRSDRRPHSGS